MADVGTLLELCFEVASNVQSVIRNNHRQDFSLHMSMLNQSTPVGKTAFDSLQAKQSAVSAGYDSIVVKNELYYKELLLAVTSEWKMKRQTPLINAGYASRVLTVSHAIHSFISYHELRNSGRIQIVLLGCGADVIGLWAHSLNPSRVAVLEVDTPEVCLSKSDILIRQQLIAGTRGDSGKLVGRIQSSDSSDSENSNYFLCPVDLRDIPKLDAVATEYLDLNAPTLVITELVLSYLNLDQTDLLLSWCSSTLRNSPNSCFLALETLGAGGSSNVIGPIDGYKQQYSELFGNKMERGLSSSSDKEGKTSHAAFYPIGSTCNDVMARFLERGFSQAYACNLGKGAAFAALPGNFGVPEIFDEHAALALYLKSYTVACAFSADTEGLMRRIMCPWHFATTEIAPSLKENIVLTVIEPNDGSSVRDLVREVYQEKFEEYPAVRKMVTHMMNSDLALSEEIEEHSTIASRYRDLGGIFFVAVQYTGERKERQVLGCVGARPWERKAKSRTLEVVRLAVNPDHRGKGVGRKLLAMVESFATSRGAYPSLIANTISILDSAKRLYESCGYKLEKEADLGGNLTMLTYRKLLFNRATENNTR
jgi:GNAT superfamily N-acetyltransferase